MTKKVGYVYNSYEIDKLVSIYLVEYNDIDNSDTTIGRSDFVFYSDYDKVIESLNNRNNEE